MEDSVFTKIIKGEIPSHKIYEDDKTLAFLDIHPQQDGQIVVVPKVQVNFVWDLDEAHYRALMDTVYKVGNRLREVMPERKHVGIMIEGLDVKDHAHVVVLPFDSATEYRTGADGDVEPDQAKLTEMAERLHFE